RVPVSARLRSILEMRRNGADGEPNPPDAYVFGDPATGQRVRSFKRAWEKAVLRAHGVKPRCIQKVIGERKVWTSTLTPDCRAELHRINLHFHDLRREAGSRWLDSGVVPLTAIRDWLGHSNISQTSTYLECQVHGQNDVMRRFEERQATLQKLATEAGTSGDEGEQTASMRDEQTRKDARKHVVQ
ncbi:MAG: tyrosine-type recombinase/integrase, partial [Vicinamibacterales bacterium]